MEDIIRPLVNHCASRPTTLAVLLFDRTKELLTAAEMFDVIIYAVATDQENLEQSRHYYVQGMKVGLIIIDERHFRQKIQQSTDRHIFLHDGEVLFERDRYMESLKKGNISNHDNKKKLGLEFVKIIQAYTIGKKLYEDGHYLDAYNFLVNALQHLARFVLLEKGIKIEPLLWKQIKNCEPEILKLFDELIKNEEPIEKRLELIFLASSFLIYSKTQIGAAHILEVLGERHLWSYEMIEQHPQIRCYGSCLGTLLEYLIEKELLYPIDMESNFSGIYERHFQVKKTC